MRALYADQCRLGVCAVYREVFGEHFIAALSGYPEVLDWLTRRLEGGPPPDECG